MEQVCAQKNNLMSSPAGMSVSVERQIPTQMSGDRAGSQCGLSSLLPMSCRGRAAAFARDLHSRLRNLGAAHDDDCETSWLANDARAASPSPNRAHSTQRDHDTFYDFALEPESPSSPVDELDNPFPSARSPVEDSDPPFYDVECDHEVKESKQQQSEKKKNGFKYSTSFYSNTSPVKLQPAPRENGHTDKRLFSPITFEGCERQNSYDEVDNIPRPTPAFTDTDCLSLPLNQSSTLDSDSEFESAKSEPSDEIVIGDKKSESNVTEALDDVSLKEVPSLAEISTEEIEASDTKTKCLTDYSSLEVLTSEVPQEKEISSAPETEPSLLNVETKIDHHDEDDDRPQRVRRCSSLKTGKTPPGTPGRKKIVRFADVLGLDLADVKTFMDDIPVIPKSAYDDLTGCDVSSSPPVTRLPQQRFGTLTLVPLFQLSHDVTEKLERQNVCLESARVCEGVHVSVCGTVRVRNLDFHKTVHIRYTMNRWRTFSDLQATYVQGSCDGYSDRFHFTLYAPCITSGQRLEIAVRFQCKGQQYWDNNCGANYCFDCLALGGNPCLSPSGPLHPTVDWHPSFY